METSFTGEYRKWIEKLSKSNFDELVLNYAKEYYGTKNAYLTDGPYDGGIDLVYTSGHQSFKKNIQITVQEAKYENKLERDLAKSKENVLLYNYCKTLDFYISQSISPEKKKKLIKDADIQYQIALRIIDANELAGLAKEYKSIRETIHKYNKAAFPEEKLSLDSSTKILFDTLSMGRDVTSIKNNFIHSLILTQLYNRTSATVDEIFNDLNDTFFGKYNRNFFETEVGRLKTLGRIIDVPETRPKKFKLTDDTNDTLREIEQNAQIHERELISSFLEVLSRYDLANETSSILDYIVELYNANYEIDESELLNGGYNHNKKILGIFDQLLVRLQNNHKIDKEGATSIARQLLVICSKNEFLNKTSISKMFTNLFKSDKLEIYLNTSRRKVYLDTQILLQIVCYGYEDVDYQDPLYQAVKYLINCIDNSAIPICLHTTIGYVEEVAWQLYNGLQLERFLELDYIKDLGPSKNVFFNFYLNIRDNDSSLSSFADFVEQLTDVSATPYNKTSFIEELIHSLIERFELLGTKVESPILVENYDRYKREYENVLSYLKFDQKSYDARKNDLNTILHLSDMHFDTDEKYFTEPFLITWDTSFYEIRETFRRKFKELNPWYLYPPMKFANTIAVINMKIDSTAINYNIVSLVEENFNLSNDSISFLDVINGLFSDKDAKKWKLANKLAKIRKRLMEGPRIEDFHKVQNKNLPLDEFLMLVQRFYQNPINRRKYRDLTSLFQNNEYADRISQLIEDHLKDFQIKNSLNPTIIESIDKMIIENNKG